jgi:hypothetical protein
MAQPWSRTIRKSSCAYRVSGSKTGIRELQSFQGSAGLLPIQPQLFRFPIRAAPLLWRACRGSYRPASLLGPARSIFSILSGAGLNYYEIRNNLNSETAIGGGLSNNIRLNQQRYLQFGIKIYF